MKEFTLWIEWLRLKVEDCCVERAHASVSSDDDGFI